MRTQDFTDIGEHGGAPLLPLDTVLERAKIRADGFTNLDVERVGDLNIGWRDMDAQHRESGWYARLDGRDMLLTQQAVRSAVKAMGCKDHSFWEKSPDKDALPKMLKLYLENASGKRKYPKRLMVRHDGINVRAVLPFNYTIRDGYDLLEMFAEKIGKVGKIQGVSEVMDSGETSHPGDLVSYRVVMSQNIMPKLKDEFGQFMMYMVSVSETGRAFIGGNDAYTSMGFFRSSCTNSAIRGSVGCKWNHRSKGLPKFTQDSTERIRTLGYYQDYYTRAFDELLNRKLKDVTPRDLLGALKDEKLITSGHYDAAEMYVGEPTEDGRPVSTEYDFFNVLTRAAQDLPSLMQRQQAETKSLLLMTEKGGIYERMRDAAKDRARNAAMRGRPLEGDEADES